MSDAASLPATHGVHTGQATLADWWALRRHPEFIVGAKDMGAVCPGLAAWALMTGVAMVNSGLSVTEAIVMCLLVFAGSAQLAALPLLAASAPAWVVLATSFCVNLRFVVFSAHLRPYFIHLPLAQRLGIGYLTGDLSYVLLVKRHPEALDTPEARQASLAYVWGGDVVNWFNWQFFSLVGILIANAVPTSWGLGFAGVLALLGVGASLANSPLRRIAAGVAGAAAVAAWALPFKLNILVAIAAAVALGLVLEHLPMFKPADELEIEADIKADTAGDVEGDAGDRP